ncbi:transposase [Streptomyces sp. NBRC 110611]|uniref:transposase n=1 Tax=Streptomyces sp. NBRC 110611 TaxID=1621259 RepID=UPI0015EE6AEB|nr:transposase [Streptomyces sp. NBRC 110611]
MQIALRSSKTISEVGRELGINPETLRGWVKKHKQRNESPAGASLSLDERARLNDLGRRTRELEKENAFLKKPQRTSRGNPSSEQVRVHRRDESRN